MNLVDKVCRSGYSRINNIYKFGGCLSRGASTLEKYKITWNKPAKVCIIDPSKSGDLGLNITTKGNEIPVYYDYSKELEDSNDIVKKMFSLEFQHKKEVRNLLREKTMALVKRHRSDRGSPESRIAAMTSEIHYIQKYFKENPHDKRAKVFLKELIEARQKSLKKLRTEDYRRFEWLLETLNLIYKPMPIKFGQVPRKESIRRRVQEYCDEIVQSKLDAYKAELKDQQKNFYLEKAEKLAFIRKEELECGLTPTVTEEDIECARKKAESFSDEINNKIN